MDVEKYITAEHVMAFMDARSEESPEYEHWAKFTLRAVLPGILAQHKRDLLVEFDKQWFEGDQVNMVLDPYGYARDIIVGFGDPEAVPDA